MGAKLGQHFLRDARIARRIIDAAELKPGERVLEVGPGPGTLTHLLSEAVGPDGEVVAIEADQQLALALKPELDENVQLLVGDAVREDYGNMEAFDAIVANLPYQISGPITFRFLYLLASRPWSRAVLMYQKEFADRLMAEPGSKQYGRLTVHAARYCRVEKIRDVPPGAFDPPPKVRSTVVRLTPHAKPPFEVDDELWQQTVDQAFGQRRKQLRNSLPHAATFLEAWGWSQRRPETLRPEEFARIANALAQ